MSGSPQALLDELIAWATPEASKDDLIAARKVYFHRTGEVFDDDRTLEMRMTGFLEHYVCDRVAPHFASTPARARYLEALRLETPARAEAWHAFGQTVHGLFEVAALKRGAVRLLGLFSRLPFVVTERRQMLGLQVGDVLECRLIPFEGAWWFSGAMCFHPHRVSKLIRNGAKALRGAPPEAEADFTADCAQRALKVDRYRQIAVERIYDFQHRLF